MCGTKDRMRDVRYIMIRSQYGAESSIYVEHNAPSIIQHALYTQCSMFYLWSGGHFEFDQIEFFQDASSAEISHFVF